MSEATESRIPCSTTTRERVKALKRGGESYDELLQKMADQYDPDRQTCDWCDETDDLQERDVANEETGEIRTGVFCKKHRRKIESYQADKTTDLEVEA